MHIPARPRQAPIVAGNLPADERAVRLWERLAPQHWPVPPDHFPAGCALVGGAVRDALLGRLAPCPDLDLVVPGAAISLGRQLARRCGGTCVVLDSERDIARLVLRGWTLDLARQEGNSLEQDLRRRDYTANAIALPLAPGSPLLDPTGGLGDLRAARLAAVSEANLLADPLRLLRGLRLEVELELVLEARSRNWIRRHGARLAEVAGERVLTELEKLATAPGGERGLAGCAELSLLAPWGADATAEPVLLSLSLEQAEACGLGSAAAWALPLARLAALLPPEALGQLRASRQLQQRSGRLRRWWRRLTQAAAGAALTEAEQLQLHLDLEADLPALLLFLPAPQAKQQMERWHLAEDPLFHPSSPLNGVQLQQALGLAPGPELGVLMRHLTLERAFGRIPPQDPAASREALIAARAWLDRRHG